MQKKSTYQNQVKINPYVRTAIIYSMDDLFAYTVEIKDGKHSYYLSKKGEPLKFGNMAYARQAAINENAQEAYLALSKTYEEVDLSTCHSTLQDRYDYSPMVLHFKK